jgi:microsomal epoxide hydrolase
MRNGGMSIMGFRASVLVLLAVLVSAHAAFAADGVVQSGDAAIHYIDTGRAASAKTLVLIPGGSTSAAIWHEQIAHFSPAMRVVAIDPRSQGASSKTPDGNTPEQRARDYEKVFAALGLKNIVLVGWSQAAQDVAAYAQAFGGTRVAAFVLVDASVSKGFAAIPADPKFAQGLLGSIALYTQHQREYLGGMMHAIFIQKMSDAQFNALVDIGMQTPSSSGAAMLISDMLGPDRTPALKKFDKPALIIASANSPELATQKAELSLLPQGKFAQVQHAGHGVFVDQPAQFDRLLAAFIAQLPA